MRRTGNGVGPPSTTLGESNFVNKTEKSPDEANSRSQDCSESMASSSQSGKTSSKNDSHISRCRWSALHGELLKHTFRQFGNDREFIAKLFPGFSKRLIYRKIGEIKAEIEESEWLPKHDEILIKAILKCASNWTKITKRYMPRKSLEQVLARVEQLKSRLKTQKAKLDLSGHSLGKIQDEDDSFQSTKHTEKTGGDECANTLEDPLLPPLHLPIERFSIPQAKNAALEEVNEPLDLDYIEEDLFNLGTKQDGRDLYFDWHDNMLALSNNQVVSFLNDFDFGIDPT